VESARPLSAMSVLEVSGLDVTLHGPDGPFRAAEAVSFAIGRGRTLGLVGESGAGKSITAMAIPRLIAGAGIAGSVRLDGTELTGLDERAMRSIRGHAIGMVFQEPRQSFNPAFTVGEQIAETLRAHRGLARREAFGRTVELLRTVGIVRAEARADDYPHTFSGGMLQRAMIAMAIACEPRLLIADEPTTALDVTVQAQVLALLKRLQASMGMAMLFVSHDMGIIAEVCDDVVVMYAGQVIECGPVVDLFTRPRHPYTAGLLRSVARVAPPDRGLFAIGGSMPVAGRYPAGCRFHPRCPFATDACRSGAVELRAIGADAAARCIRVDEITLDGANA